MANFWKIVDTVIREADILLLVIDARMIDKTKNPELERKVKSAGKTLITVINKADLVEKDTLEKYKKIFHPCVFVSAQKFYGMTRLRHMILRYSTEHVVTVGVVGYPNVGKSSIINSLKGKSSAGVSSVSGYTKGRQDIRVDSRIRIIDTPGVLADEDDKKSSKMVLTASDTKTKDPDLVACELLDLHRTEFLDFYGVSDDGEESYELLERIAKRLGKLLPGGVPDVDTTAKKILQDWQKGRIQL